MRQTAIVLTLFGLGCNDSKDTGTEQEVATPVQPIELTSSPEIAGIPVGVRTIEYAGKTGSPRQ